MGDLAYDYFSSLKVLLENLLRYEDGRSVTADHPEGHGGLGRESHQQQEIAYRPARVLMQDFTGVPAVVDLAAMRDAMVALGGDPEKINPLVPVDLVIDHSVHGRRPSPAQAFARNVELEYERNRSATRSCAGVARPSTTSASSRPAPASATR